jgi:glutathione peroxidase
MFVRLAPILLLLAAAAVRAEAPAAPPACPSYMDQDLKVLRKPESVNLCTRYAGQPLLVVNTASHCGFTGQFKGLEALHKEYAARGLKVAGFPSDDFRQEADDEEETATVCYVNYGVSFDMYSPVHVKGKDANPLFAALAAQSEAPSWNFNKYVLDRQGRVVAHFGSMTKPDDEKLRAAIEQALAP